MQASQTEAVSFVCCSIRVVVKANVRSDWSDLAGIIWIWCKSSAHTLTISYTIFLLFPGREGPQPDNDISSASLEDDIRKASSLSTVDASHQGCACSVQLPPTSFLLPPCSQTPDSVVFSGLLQLSVQEHLSSLLTTVERVIPARLRAGVMRVATLWKDLESAVCIQ